MLQRDIARVVHDKRRDPAMKNQLGASTVNFQILNAVQREGNPLETFVVVADKAISLRGSIRPEVVTARRKYEFDGSRGAAPGKRRDYSGSGIAVIARFGQNP